jgi:hypothetical protein
MPSELSQYHQIGNVGAGALALEEAVATFRVALEELARDLVPLDWALTQMNLGNALQVRRA